MSHIHKKYISEKKLFFSILLNVVITFAQLIGGILSGSLALLSDALHNFSDVISLIFSFIAHKLSRREASTEQTFGFKRAEIIAAFVNALSLIIIALLLANEAIIRYFNPQTIQSNLVIWLAILGIVMNGISVLLLKKDAEHNLNMKSAYLHLFTDMLASFAVLLGGVLMKFFGWFWVDSLLTLIISIYLINVGYKLMIKAVKMLMLFTPEHINIEEIVKIVNQISGVKKLHHIHVWHLNEEELHLEAHLDCSENLTLSQFNDLLHQIENVLYQQFHINHITLQPEYKKEDSKEIIVQD